MNFCKLMHINPDKLTDDRWFKCTAKLSDELSECEFFEEWVTFRGTCAWAQNDFYKLCNCEKAHLDARLEAKMEDI